MKPFFFGPPEQQKYGVLHEAVGERLDCGVVICYPHAYESINSLRALRLLAGRLAASGISTVRFDYRGTGDSAGDGAKEALDDWKVDVLDAIEQCRKLSGSDRVVLIGLRLGASLAAIAAAPTTKIEGIVLWEPVVDGALYAREQAANYSEWLEIEDRERPGARALAQADENFGYPRTATLEHSLSAMNLLELEVVGIPRILICSNRDEAAHAELAERLRSFPAFVQHETIRDHIVWGASGGLDASPVPTNTLAFIERWVKEVCQ